MNVQTLSDIDIPPTWIAESSFQFDMDSKPLILQIGKPLISNQIWFCAARISGHNQPKYYFARDAVTAMAAAMRGLDGMLTGLELDTVFSDNTEVEFERFRRFFFFDQLSKA